MFELVTYPDKRLTQPTKDIVDFTDNLRHKAMRLYKTMLREGGLAMAANQGGLNISMFVTHSDVEGLELIVCNPKWRPASDAKIEVMREGCLSFPGLFIDVPRYDIIDVEYQDGFGVNYSHRVYGLDAQVFQHETDHLSGQLFIDLMKE